jgi:hypothetical protein
MTVETWRCRVCGATTETDSFGVKPSGWYHLRKNELGSDDFRAVLGVCCGPECLTVGVLKGWGLKDHEVRDWIDSIKADKNPAHAEGSFGGAAMSETRVDRRITRRS